MAKTTNAPKSTDFPPGIGRPALSALLEAGYTRLEQLAKQTEADLLSLHGMGPKAMGVLREALRARGLDFARPAEGKPARKRAAAGKTLARNSDD